ncbi:MAG: TadE/TadG family type IV pilus assembly protein [Candidatus Aquicultorales bacterium]
MFSHSSRVNPDESGQAAVELALVAPLIVFLIFASTTLLEAAEKKMLVSRLASAGARMAVYHEGGSMDVGETVKRLMKQADAGSEPSRLSVAVHPAADVAWVGSVGHPTKVAVTYRVPVPLLSRIFGASIPVTSEAIVEKWPNGIFFDVEG